MTAPRAVIAERITRDDGQPAMPDEFIDEVVVRDCLAHVEMMHDRAAFMTLGDEAFWIFVEKGRLRIRYSERREPHETRSCDKTDRCVFVLGHAGNCFSLPSPTEEAA